MPITSVVSAQARTNARMIGISRSRWICESVSLITPASCGRITKIIAAANTSVKPTVIPDDAIPVDFTSAITRARMHQAVTSSTAAQVIAIDPSVVCVSPRSSRIRASTGKAVMLIATPMNNANAWNDVPAGPSSR